MNVRQTASAIHIRQRGARIRFPIKGGRIQPLEIGSIESRTAFARSLYFLTWSGGEVSRKVKSSSRFRLQRNGRAEARLEIDVSLSRKLRVSLEFVFSEKSEHLLELSVSAAPDPDWSGPFAFRCLGLVPGQPTAEVPHWLLIRQSVSGRLRHSRRWSPSA